ncbi:MAG: nitroreductase family protein [Chloroflexi bacterium]|nr:nitroreductase family protein [Chloroflexota bacterium]
MTHTTDLHTFLRSRRSILRFKPDPIPDSVIRAILHTATFAPSAHNRQPWRFVVLTEKSSITRFAEKMAAEFQQALKQDHLPPEEIQKRLLRSQERIGSAPVIIVACVDMTEMETYPDKRRRKAEYLIATQSVANAGLHILLAAHAEGLGGVWLCSPLFAQTAVRNALNIQATWEPHAMFLLGKPAETPAIRERKPLEKISIFIDRKGSRN